MSQDTPSHRAPAVQPTVCKTYVTGEDPAAVDAARDPHLVPPDETPAAAEPAPRAKKLTASKE